MRPPVDRALCVVLHDVAPATWSACEWMLDRLARHGIFRVTLLAVPRYHGQPRNDGFERWLHARSVGGDEVALHGWDHLDHGQPRNAVDRLRRNFYTRGEGEFCDLDYDSARQRLHAGRAWLGEIGIVPAGFVAPAWLLGAEAWRALRHQPFAYTCTLRHIHLLTPFGHAGTPRRIVCQSQVYSSSSAWRQRMSVVWNESLAWWQRHQPLVRLELHPSDDVPIVRRSWERLLQAQAGTRRVRTLGQVAASFDATRTTAGPPSR